MTTKPIELKRSLSPIIRPGEKTLLFLSGCFLGINFLALNLQRADMSAVGWSHFGIWVLSALVGSWLLDRFLPGRDQFLFPISMFLSGWGLILIDRLAPPFAERQTLWVVVSLGFMLVAAIFPHTLRWLRQYRYVLLLIGLVLLLGTIILGTNPSGAINAPQLWLGFGLVYFQPSEILKIILVAFLASYLAEQYPIMHGISLGLKPKVLSFSPRIIGPILLMWGLCVVILIWQRDLGTAILFFVVFILLLFVASGSNMILLSGFVLVLAAAGVAYWAFPVVQLRTDIWLNPWPEADGRAFQIVQSLLAFAAGGVFGTGVGQGSPTYIPVVHSDFVFSAVAEEWGLLGIVVVIACIVIIIAKGMQIAVQLQQQSFMALLSVGLSLLIATQSFLIMGGVLKIVPLTGVTLPFLSYGGSSLLASYIIVGLLLRMSATEKTSG